MRQAGQDHRQLVRSDQGQYRDLRVDYTLFSIKTISSWLWLYWAWNGGCFAIERAALPGMGTALPYLVEWVLALPIPSVRVMQEACGTELDMILHNLFCEGCNLLTNCRQ